jgi:hypothetical protein
LTSLHATVVLLQARFSRLERGLIGKADRIGRCRECGLLFRVLREGKEFCSPRHANTFWRREKRQTSKRNVEAVRK